MVNGVIERMAEAIVKGEAQASEADDLIRLGKKAGINLAKQETELIGLKDRLSELREAVVSETEKPKKKTEKKAEA